MANREVEREITRAYETSEGVRVIEEHLKYPLRKELPGQKLEAKHICEFDLVTFEKDGGKPVFWVRESAHNQCSDRDLKTCVHTAAFGEMNAKRLEPEEITLYVERKDESVNKIPYYTPAMGEGKFRDDPEVFAGRKEIDEACKQNLGCKENLASQHSHTLDLSKESLSSNKQEQSEQLSPGQLSKERLLAKLEVLKQEAEQEQGKKK